MKDREKAIVMAHTGICMLTGDKLQIFYRYEETFLDKHYIVAESEVEE